MNPFSLADCPLFVEHNLEYRKMSILLLADEFDAHSDLIESKLRDRGLTVYRMNLDVPALQNTHATFANGEWHVVLPSGNVVCLSDISAVYLRRAFVEMSLEEREKHQDDGSRIWENEWNRTLTGIYYSLQNASWLNPLRPSYQAENKYIQYERAQKIGFAIPKMLVSNDKTALREFCTVTIMTPKN